MTSRPHGEEAADAQASAAVSNHGPKRQRCPWPSFETRRCATLLPERVEGTSIPLLLALPLALLSTHALAQPMFPPGSRIGIVPPPGMTPSDRFQGFEDRPRGAMLVVTR